MKYLILLLALSITACNETATVQITPTVHPVKIIQTTMVFFTGTVDGQEKYFDDKFYVCLAGYAYSRDNTSVVLTGADLQDITCADELKTLLYTGNTPNEVYTL